MLSLLASATLTLGLFANAVLAGGYTNADVSTTETQEIGSTTSEGAIWYSMNVCEIVQHTQCDVSLSQGGAAPPEETGGAGNYPPPPSEPEPSAPASGEPEYSPPAAGEEPVPTEGGEQPPPSEGEPAPTGEQPPPTEGPAPTEGEGGGEQPAPTVLTTTNEAGEESTLPGTLVPATTSGGGSAVPSGSATEESPGPSTTAGALALMPAAVPAMAIGGMALLMIAI